MVMFDKIVGIEPLGLESFAIDALYTLAKEVVLYDDLPQTDAEIIKRIADADAVLVSYTTEIRESVLRTVPNVKYIGMCCSLYSPESANVDILFAKTMGIDVRGVRDYGDVGVKEYVIHELVGFLHGYNGKMYKDMPYEITDLKVGIVGMGTTGRIIKDVLQNFDADLSYYSRTRYEDVENEGVKYMDFYALLEDVDVLFTCLNKNVILMDQDAFNHFGHGKVMFNTSIGPSFEVDALRKWLDEGSNEFFCDSNEALGNLALLDHPHVNCRGRSSGRTKQALVRLSEKVLKNIHDFQEN